MASKKSKKVNSKKTTPSLTPAQAHIVSAIGDSKGVSVDDLIVNTGRTASSIRGLLGRLEASKFVSKNKNGEYRLLKKAKVEILSLKTYSKAGKVLKGLSVKKIDSLDDSSAVHISSLLLQADKLPPEALHQLRKVLDKHGDKAVSEGMGLNNWPESPVPLYQEFKQSPEDVEFFECRVEGYASLDLDMKKDAFCKGKLDIASFHPETLAMNQINYYSAFNFLDKAESNGVTYDCKALAKFRSMKDRTEKEGLGLNGRRIFFYARLNYLKGFKTSANATLHVYDFHEIK